MSLPSSIARAIQLLASAGAMYLALVKLLGPRYSVSAPIYHLFAATPGLKFMRLMLGFGELLAAISLAFGWSWDAFGGVSTGAVMVVASEVMLVFIARHFYGGWLAIETGAMIAYTILFFLSGYIERPLDLCVPDRTPADEIAHLSKFLPPPAWKREAAAAEAARAKQRGKVEPPLELLKDD